MSIQLQWSLDNTANSALSISRSIFLATTHDNVQPLALAACEKFGNTIAMCQETCSKVELLTGKTAPPVVIRFIRGSAGYDSGDCATHLSRSQAGVQFLGLAAALATSLGPFEGANSLHMMLTSSAADKTLLPTTRQLNDLLSKLEPRLTQSGFLDSVAGWHLLMSQLITTSGGDPERVRHWYKYPSSDGVAALIDAFRRVSRIGDAAFTKVSIRAGHSVPWIIAFTKWCLGSPPSIKLLEGESVLSQPGSQVELIVSPTEPWMNITIYDAINTPTELIQTKSSGEAFSGMVSVDKYCRWRLFNLSLDTGLVNRALIQALPYALKKVTRRVVSTAHIGTAFTSFGITPFPSEHVIAQTMSTYLNIPVANALQTQDGLTVQDLPIVRTLQEALRKTCRCQDCDTTAGSRWTTCGFDLFIKGVALICADILALSLFDNTAYPLLHLRHWRSERSSFNIAVEDELKSDGTESARLDTYQPYQILRHTLRLVGHEVPQSHDANRWMISSNKGQVVYPVIYETLCYEKEGYLTLNCLPGLLLHNGNTHGLVVAGETDQVFAGDGLSLSRQPVTEPQMLFSDLNSIWLVSEKSKTLEVSLGLQPLSGGSRMDLAAIIPPSTIFTGLATAFIVEDCPHNSSQALQTTDKFCHFTHPLKPYPTDNTTSDISMVGVVAVDGSNLMRFVSVITAESSLKVLRKRACLSCCLDVCRKTASRLLVL